MNLYTIFTGLVLVSLVFADLQENYDQPERPERGLRPLIRVKRDDVCHGNFSGWTKYKDACYTFYTSPAGWEAARQTCLDIGADLACPLDDDENNFLAGLPDDGKFAWLGGNEQHESEWKWSDGHDIGVWVWQDGRQVQIQATNNEPLVWALWLDGQPDNSDGNENCMLIEGGKWGDVDCSSEYPFLCKKVGGGYRAKCTMDKDCMGMFSCIDRLCLCFGYADYDDNDQKCYMVDGDHPSDVRERILCRGEHRGVEIESLVTCQPPLVCGPDDTCVEQEAAERASAAERQTPVTSLVTWMGTLAAVIGCWNIRP